MKVFVDLKVTIAVGVCGIALMELKEEVVETYGMRKSDIKVDSLTMQDIESCGIEEWYEHSLYIKPSEAGVYTFFGRASFDEDSADYSLWPEESQH